MKHPLAFGIPKGQCPFGAPRIGAGIGAAPQKAH